MQDTPSSESLNFPAEKKSNESVSVLHTQGRNSTNSPNNREAPKASTALTSTPPHAPIPIRITANVSPELTKVLLQNVQAFEENACSTKSGDGPPRPHTPAIDWGTIQEEPISAENTGPNSTKGGPGGNEMNLQTDPVEHDSSRDAEYPITKDSEQDPSKRLSKFEDYDIYDYEQQDNIDNAFQMPDKDAPFTGKRCIDDFNSSSDEFSGMSENENMLPLVESVPDSQSCQPPSYYAYPLNPLGEDYQLEVSLKANPAPARLSNEFSLSGGNFPVPANPVRTEKEEVKNKQRSNT